MGKVSTARSPALAVVLAALLIGGSWALGAGCGPADGDGDADSDADTDGDTDTDSDSDADSDADGDDDADAADGDGDGDADADEEVDGDVDGGADGDADADEEADADADEEADADADAEVDADADGASGPTFTVVDKGTELPYGTCPDDGSGETLTATSPGPGRIVVDHGCGYFNCCTTLAPEIVIGPPTTMTIIEHETGPMCFCEAHFNPHYEIHGVSPGLWTVAIGTLTADVLVE